MGTVAALEPCGELIRRAKAELGEDFCGPRPCRVSRAPGRLDVMGGIADYTGSLVAEMPLDRAAAVLLAERKELGAERSVQVMSFNLLDENRPFTMRVPMEALASGDTHALRSEFDRPGRKFGGYVAGCVHILAKEGLIDLSDPEVPGLNFALYSTVPLGAGVSSSAAIEVATMVNLIDHFGLREKVDGVRAAALCQKVENEVVGAPCGLMDQMASCVGGQDSLMLMTCQPHELHAPLRLPAGVRVAGINSNVKHSVGGGQYGITRCAAFMAHTIILDRMRIMGEATGHKLVGDPLKGYLANLDPEDYKRLFRQYLPEWISGEEFLQKYPQGTIDRATRVERGVRYPVQHAADHHVLEPMRVKNFVEFLRRAEGAEGRDRQLLLDKAGHLMYASHLSYTNDAMLGAEECDLLVKLVRENEHAGLYGAKITGGGSGGTVAILCDVGASADAAIERIRTDYTRLTGKATDLFGGSSPGAWAAGTAEV